MTFASANLLGPRETLKELVLGAASAFDIFGSIGRQRTELLKKNNQYPFLSAWPGLPELPDLEHMRESEACEPGSARRIMREWETSAIARQAEDKAQLKTMRATFALKQKIYGRSQLTAFVLMVTVDVCATLLVIKGSPWGASVLFAGCFTAIAAISASAIVLRRQSLQ